MEQFPASSISQMEYIEKMFQTTDFIVLIIAGRYGSINKETGLSYTESEIQLAKKMKIPILVFMLNENAIENLPVKYSESDSVLKEKLSLFRNSFKQTLINFYSDKEDLKLKIIKSVNQFIKDNDLTGWIRADEFSNEIKEKDDVINSLEVKIKNLETTTSEIELEPLSNSEVINALRIGELEAEKTDLSLEAQELLKEAAISTSGQIKYLKVLGEPTLSVNGKEMLLEKDN